MGELRNADRWGEKLPPHVVRALEETLEKCDFDLCHEGWFSGGRSGEPVAWAVRKYDDDADQVVVKFFKDDGDTRIANLHHAWKDSEKFQHHLAETEQQTIHLGTWRGVFMVVAGGALRTTMGPVIKLLEKPGAPDHIRTIIRSIVNGWNNGKVDRHEATVGEVLGDIMRRRRPGAEEWARSRGIPLGETADRITLTGFGYLTNPFDLLTGNPSHRQINHLVGKAHGDLNGHNIIVRLAPSVIADSFTLIDYDRYATKAPLTRDPMHLLVALALEEFKHLKPLLWPPVAEVLVDPHRTDIAPRYEPFRQIAQAVYEASVPPERKGFGDEWAEQCLLGLVGAGLLHLGRDLDVPHEHDAKVWCLYLAALAAETYLDRVPPEAHVGRVATADRAVSETRNESIVDRDGPLRVLQSRLADGPGGVTVLRGARGVGKTKLMNVVLCRLTGRSAARSPHVHRHNADRITGLNTETLVDYVTNSAGLPHRNGSALVRLEAALKSLGDSPVVIAVDSAENLLDPATSQLIDPELDEALQVVANEQHHRVTVLLVSQQDPASPGGGTWADPEMSIVLGKLPPDDFHKYLKSLDHNGICDPYELSEVSRGDLYRKMLGNPRLAELGHAITCEAGTGLDLSALVERLRDQDPRHVHTFLARTLLDGLDPVKQQVLRALAAFGTPVPASAVIGLIDDQRPDVVRRVLSVLAAERVVRVSEDQYTVSPEDAKLILPDDSDNSSLYFHAATQLTQLQNRNPRGVEDLRVHLAELKALLRAGENQSAYGLIDHIHDLLEQWNCTPVLREEREQLKGALGDQHLEMANRNALAGIYTSLDLFTKAADEYGHALKIAESLRDDVSKLKIHLNLGAMYWRRDVAELAFNQYEFARENAVRLGRHMELMGALQGKAFCHRRFGEYDKAFDCAQTALALPEHPDFPDTAAALRTTSSLRVALALGLARWHAELGRQTDADAMMDIARTTAGEHPGSWLDAACTDGRADMLFCRGDLEQAERVAHSAVDQALRINDEGTLLRARTTLSMIYLSSGRLRQAWVEIDRVQRRRKEGRSLLVLALHAIAAWQQRDHAAAHERFKVLFKESDARRQRDSRDFAAWDFRGFALCGIHLFQRRGLDEAIASFGQARLLTPLTPVLIDRMKFLLEQVDKDGDLRSAIDVLE